MQQGCARALGLPQFFLSNDIVKQYGRPAAVFAMAPGSAGSDSSVRPLETVAPTAQALGVKIQDPATRLDYSTLINAVVNNSEYDGKTVLIAWEHKAIPGLAQALGVTLDEREEKWPGIVFDEAWIIGMKDKSLQIIPEQILPTDNPFGGPQDWGNGSTGLLNQSFMDQFPQCQNDTALDDIVFQLSHFDFSKLE